MWMIIVALLVLAFAAFLFWMGFEIFEEGRFFMIGVAVFFMLFIGAAVAISVFGPHPEGSANVAALFDSAFSLNAN